MSDRASIALVNMPFGYSKYPSIQLGTLSALLKSHGLGVKTYYLNLLFAHRIGVPLYERLCEKRALFGEWLFSYLLFRDNPKRAEYLATFKPVFEDISRESGHPISYFEEMATRIAPQFLSWAMTAIDWGQYKIVGFTSTFDQNVASLSLAKLIKDLYPSVKIVFGGANYDGEMGLEHLRAFPWIDCVVIGEGEEVFPPLVKQILEGREGRFPPGVAYRQDGRVRFEPNPNLFSDFQRMVPLDYDDYYEQLGEVEAGPSKGLDRMLLYEGSRGCWWGEKHHCTFCGLNAQAMEFRAKSPGQVFEEFKVLSSRYNTTRFRFVDNIIDMQYIDELFAKFARERLDLEVFIETKSNLSKQQIQTLAHGGVKSMQPGIESLSQNQLTEMKKGVSPQQNLQTLKWSLYYDIHLAWNILLGFPGETNEDYRRQVDLILSILHFQPPEAVGEIWIERFSPYWKWPEQNGIRITGPGLAYEYVYDPRKVDLNEIAYDFEYELVEKRVDPSLMEELTRLTHEWQRLHATDDKPFLYYSKAMDFVTVFDGRAPDKPVKQRYDWPHAFIIEFCNDAPKYFGQIRGELNDRAGGAGYDEATIKQALNELLQKRVLYEEKGRYFTLALPVNRTF